jgi:SAM-dependent methyltransferase
MFRPGEPTFLELARRAPSSTERGYDLLSAKFDLPPFRTPDWLVESALARLGEADDALDVCCGTGAGIQRLRVRCYRQVVGVDFSAGMLAEARRRSAAAPRLRACLSRVGDWRLSPQAQLFLRRHGNQRVS